ncbi:hypothetical protein GOBAR_AA04443 [Gossypium barbadense]|uniref:Uncharacterized protein n=1 Tax=Gossypium barbadense TaxID=3634 RepID=A0A2P5YKK0_GOSBA|nr:hypothetical protein GOBAR_AA04443 [Gossypium barbadense]
MVVEHTSVRDELAGTSRLPGRKNERSLSWPKPGLTLSCIVCSCPWGWPRDRHLVARRWVRADSTTAHTMGNAQNIHGTLTDIGIMVDTLHVRAQQRLPLPS